MLPGLKAVLNVHPLFVHFPIGLWIGALIFEMIAVLRKSDDWHRTAARLLYLGTICAGIAILTGLSAQKSVPPGPAMTVVGIHETLMMIASSLALALSLFALIFRKDFNAGYKKLMLVGMCLLAVLLVLGTDRGVQLVYGYGSAVDWSTAQPQK